MPSPENWFLDILLAQKIKEREGVAYEFDYCVFQYPSSVYSVAPSGLGNSGGAAVLERGVLKNGGCWHEERVPPEGPDLALASLPGTCVEWCR